MSESNPTLTAKAKAKRKKAEETVPLEQDDLIIEGARVHNLKNIDVVIPRNQLVVITGISGSGKSSLAFDTIYAEGQRRYMESFSAYARQFMGTMERPEVDKVTGLSPVISIEQKTTSRNPRSTVGTVTEIYDFMRLLYARASEAWSYLSGKKMVRYTEDQILEAIFKRFKGKKLYLLAPLVRGRKGHYRELFEQVRRQGYMRVRIDGELADLTPRMQVDRYKIHDIEVVIDQLKVEKAAERRIRRSLSTGLEMGKGGVMLLEADAKEPHSFSKKLMCPETGLSYEEPSPNTFSFNSPYGACPTCKGLGVIQSIDLEAVIPDKSLSVNKGGIAPLGEVRDTVLFTEVRRIAKKYKFTMSTPVGKIPAKGLDAILYGDGNTYDEEEDGPGPIRWYSMEYGGVSGLIQRCFKGTQSEGMRRWAESFMKQTPCESCGGTRLRKEALWFKFADKNISELAEMDLDKLAEWFKGVEKNVSARQKKIAKDVLKEIRERLGFLLDVGLDYLAMNRPARSLSGGESQRIRLATQIGSQLQGITYILDEPSIGLHQRDNHRLIKALKELAAAGNSVLVVEHDEDIMKAADHIIDLGPGAGVHGGELVGEGGPGAFKKIKSLTADYLNGRLEIPVPAERRKGNGKQLTLKGATGNNLKDVEVSFPLGTLICVCGVSGSGKSTLITETLYPILHNHIYKATKKVYPHKRLNGINEVDKVIEIDQSPIGRTPRSNPATYIGLFSEIRNLFAQLPEAKIRGYKPGRFSFNVKVGRCEKCEGAGMQTIEMNFLPDVYVQCDQCQGKRYKRETLEVLYKGKSIADVLDMTVDTAVEFFEHIPKIFRKVKTLQEVGLGYIKIGQSSTTLSGGEAQRVKLASELTKRDTGQTFYILDEPTTGLHFEDIRVLMGVLDKLVQKGNTVLIIEHNLDVVKLADHIIDLGPEGGNGGGTIVAEGTPEEIVKVKASHTGRYLKEVLA